jgi:hypothetical protein
MQLRLFYLTGVFRLNTTASVPPDLEKLTANKGVETSLSARVRIAPSHKLFVGHEMRVNLRNTHLQLSEVEECILRAVYARFNNIIMRKFVGRI